MFQNFTHLLVSSPRYHPYKVKIITIVVKKVNNAFLSGIFYPDSVFQYG